MKALNEGTTANIIVKMKDGTYRASFLQYGAGSAERTLKTDYKTQKKAERLVQQTGDIRSIVGDEIDYYSDRNILDIFNSLEELVDKIEWGNFVYYFDGKKWIEGKSKVKKEEEKEYLYNKRYKQLGSFMDLMRFDD